MTLILALWRRTLEAVPLPLLSQQGGVKPGTLVIPGPLQLGPNAARNAVRMPR